ncbi:MAG: hypothetical protein COB41_10120 [Proteobacteria bacterium]|nr:MAG: hypothetical protein COB41_10120 [Pseudomonadota bacterium]
MLGDIKDFIIFSENNIQRERKLALIHSKIECDKVEFDDPNLTFQYQQQEIYSVEYRFDVSLTQSIRYAGVVTLVTTIEWCLLSLSQRALFPIKEKEFDKNDSVNILMTFNSKATLNLKKEITFIATLIHIKNCIAHASGLLNSYKYSELLIGEISQINGVSV